MYYLISDLYVIHILEVRIQLNVTFTRLKFKIIFFY